MAKRPPRKPTPDELLLVVRVLMYAYLAEYPYTLSGFVQRFNLALSEDELAVLSRFERWLEAQAEIPQAEEVPT